MEIDIELWKKNVIEAVSDIASEEFQRSTWFGNSDVISTPDDVYIALFDDFTFDEYFLENKEVSLTNEQKESGRRLINQMREYSPGRSHLPDPKIVIDDPEWGKVRDAARKFLKSMGVDYIESHYWEKK